MNFRNERLSKLLREECSKLLVREIVLPGALLTVTEAYLDVDLEHVRMSISVLPHEKEKEALRLLKKEKERLRQLLMKHVPMKFFPKLEFSVDEGFEYAARVEKLLMKEDNKE